MKKKRKEERKKKKKKRHCVVTHLQKGGTKIKREEFGAGSSRKRCLWMSALNGEWM